MKAPPAGLPPDLPPRPPEHPPRNTRDPRRGALIGLAITALLIVGALLLVHVLKHMSQVQDCALSGRRDCTD
ncbi:MAG TPA: hypothetical protein VMB48_08985 [Steroidobacteraceae bacterium]|nr:hypothetical protein [Steroidobacteraceae bacterium]